MVAQYLKRQGPPFTVYLYIESNQMRLVKDGEMKWYVALSSVNRSLLKIHHVSTGSCHGGLAQYQRGRWFKPSACGNLSLHPGQLGLFGPLSAVLNATGPVRYQVPVCPEFFQKLADEPVHVFVNAALFVNLRDRMHHRRVVFPSELLSYLLE